MKVKTLVRLQPDPVEVVPGTDGRAYCDKCETVTEQYVSSIGSSDDDEPSGYDTPVESLFGEARSPVFWWRCRGCEDLDGCDPFTTLMTVLAKRIDDGGLLRAS